MSGTAELPASLTALTPLLPGFGPIEKALTARGLRLADFGQAFGPELGAVLDWPGAEMQPALLLALDVRDREKARGFVEAFTATDPAQPPWKREDQVSATLYLSPGTGVPMLTPALALSEKFLVLGLSRDAVTASLARLQSDAPRLDAGEPFRTASGTVRPPTGGFAYLDARRLFERAYGFARPFLAMSLALDPQSAQSVDAGKLPSAEAIAKHLGPSVYSQADTEHGTLIESAGTLTANQLVVSALAVSGVAAFPMIQQTLQNGVPFPGNFNLAPPSPVPIPPPVVPAPPALVPLDPRPPASTPPTAPGTPPPVATPAPEAVL